MHLFCRLSYIQSHIVKIKMFPSKCLAYKFSLKTFFILLLLIIGLLYNSIQCLSTDLHTEILVYYCRKWYSIVLIQIHVVARIEICFHGARNKMNYASCNRLIFLVIQAKGKVLRHVVLTLIYLSLTSKQWLASQLL